MFKRIYLTLALTIGLLAPSYAAGIVPGFSLTPQYDKSGNIAPGCILNVIQAGTVGTPQIAYQDSGLTIPAIGGSTLTCDATGRLPQFFLADGLIKFILSTSTGTLIFTQDNLLVVGPSSGGGGGGTVDPTTIMQTGHIEAFYGTGILTGFVRLNGRTIGSATSGATERANADCQALFQYLWGADSNLAVSTGRGASANADWVANKQLTLPDFRNRAIAGLGDMGNSDAALFAGVTFTNGNSTTLGSTLGAGQSRLTSTSMFPPYSPTGTITNGAISVTVNGTAYTANGGQPGGGGAAGGAAGPNVGSASQATSTFTGTSVGSSAPFSTVSPLNLVTIYGKL